jgi:hypothetical protein
MTKAEKYKPRSRDDYKDTRYQVTIAEAEANHIVLSAKLGSDPVPFGFRNTSWRDLLSQMQEGDELWEFESSPHSWNNLAGRAGIELVRKGVVVGVIINRMN